jgi:hypothetical protein
MTNEEASSAPSALPAAPGGINLDEDALASSSDDPAFDRLFGRDADGAPLWLRTEELLRIDDVDGENEIVDDGNENENNAAAAATEQATKSKDAFDAEAYIAEAKKLVRGGGEKKVGIGQQGLRKEEGEREEDD